jgi:hypothetical protein
VLDNKVKLRQKAVIEYVIKHKQCMECIREATDHSWGAMIQVRQVGALFLFLSLFSISFFLSLYLFLFLSFSRSLLHPLFHSLFHSLFPSLSLSSSSSLSQKVGHKQSLFMLEHLLTKAGLHNLMISINICKEGLDLFFKVRD